MSEKNDVLSGPRRQIDRIDNEILQLVKERHEAVQEVSRTKMENRLPIFVADREQDKIRRFREKAEALEINPNWAEDLLHLIMGGSRASQSAGPFPNAAERPQTIVIVGGGGGMGSRYAHMFEKSGHKVRILEKNDWNKAADLLRGADAVIIAVPIPQTSQAIRDVAPLMDGNTILADFTSNKNGLLDLMLKTHAGPVVSLHPMHGPGTSNLSKQLLLVCRGRGDQRLEWFLNQFALWGMRLKEVDARKHDHAMDMIQGLRHFVALLHGSFMRYYDLRPEDIIDFSSPIYHAELMMTVRMFAQDAELYADIVFSNEQRRELLMKFFEHHKRLSEMVANDDKQGFKDEFEAVHHFFGDFADRALTESEYLIGRLSDRFG